MTELIVTVEESKSKFIMKLLREFDYVQVKRKKKSKKHTAEDQRILDNISEAVKELNQYKRGEIELQDADSYIKELKAEGYL